MLESLDLLMLRAQYALPAAIVASMPALSYQLSRQPHCVQQNFDRFLLTKLVSNSYKLNREMVTKLK